MPTTNTTADADTREATASTRATAARVQRDAEEAEQIAALALTDLVRAVTASIRMFVPPVMLQPEVAIRLAATAVEQLVEMQRRFLVEVLTAGREAVSATDIEPIQFAVRSAGRSTTAA